MSEGTKDEGEEQFSLKYVKELREEAAGHRVALKPYKDAFATLSETEITYMLDLVAKISTDQPAAAIEMRDLSYQLAGEDAFLTDVPWTVEEIGGVMPEETDTETKSTTEPLTVDAVAAMLDARDAAAAEANTANATKAQEESAIAEIIAEAEAAGFSPGTKEYAMLMWTASNETDGDITKAAEVTRQVFPVADAEPVEEAPPGEFPTTATAGGVSAQPSPPVEPPSDLAQARTAMEARLARSNDPG
jgi:hypothetical protein